MELEFLFVVIFLLTILLILIWIAEMTFLKPPFDVFGSLDPVPEHRFFVVTEFMDKWDLATKELTEWIRKGEIKYKESVLEGFENMPQGLRNVLSGKNFGKQLIKV